MSIEREYFGGPIAFICDNCSEVMETHCRNFNGALALMKSRGWRVTKASNDWHHYCKDC